MNLRKEIVKKILQQEDLWQLDLEKLVARGQIVIPVNPRHKSLHRPMALGKHCTTKINANLGTSPLDSDLKTELKKMAVAVQFGADAVMDLSTGKDLDKKRKELVAACPVPIGSVPLYQVMEELPAHKKFDVELFFDVLEKHCMDGMDFVTIHCGITQKGLEHEQKQPRLMGIVSRGGSFLAQWMKKTGKENPLYTEFDRIMKLLKKYQVTISLGDGLRPGCLADATDAMQLEELQELGHLVRRARKAGVQAIVEGPGHVPLQQIEENIRLQKRLCDGAPFYVLGPLVTDTSPGYDHITAAIGGAVAGMYGADFLCYVTPSEHLALPSVDDVKEGVIALKIAAHAADIAKGLPRAWEQDVAMAKARKQFDWKTQIALAPDPGKAQEYYDRIPRNKDHHMCSMCGRHCSLRKQLP